MPLDPITTLQRLIQIPSVNPMGRDINQATKEGEARMTALLTEICIDQGWPYFRQPVHPGRENLIALIAGTPPPQEGGKILLWDVHQDTVAIEGMTIDPFAGEIRDGRVYGRGACDVKGSMASMLAALSRVDRTTADHSPTIILACTVNEECGFTGAKALMDFAATRRAAFHIPPIFDVYFPGPPDVAIVAEPTQFDIVVAHQGQVRWRCHSIGRAAHTSRPDEGINAIYAMAQIVQAIEGCHRDFCATAPEHPLCGRPSVCVSTIRGGVGINTVPDRATIEIDRRLGPSESPQVAYEELVRYIAEHADAGHCRVEHDLPFMHSTGLSDSNNGSLAKELAALVHQHGLPGRVTGVPYGTDAAAISAVGIPTVVFGPGSIQQAHTADEFIAIEQLELATEIFYRIAQQGLCLNCRG